MSSDIGSYTLGFINCSEMKIFYNTILEKHLKWIGNYYRPGTSTRFSVAKVGNFAAYFIELNNIFTTGKTIGNAVQCSPQQIKISR